MGAAEPYVGARPFTHGQRLFGRDRERRELGDILIAERIVLLHSPSGAGKTSLLQGRGGVADTLRDEGFEVLPVVRVGLPPAGARRGNRYADSVLSCVDHRARGATLDAALRSLVPERPDVTGVVLIVDQFEEILTVDPAGEAARLAFFHDLGRALADRRLWVLFALREEHLGALAPYRPMVPTHLRTSYRLDLLGRAAAREAIVQPAREAGVPFTERAAEKLLDELCTTTVPLPGGAAERRLGSAVEPVELQVVCHRIWQRRAPEATEIAERDIDAVASVDAALYDYYGGAVAEAAAAAGANERALREWIDGALITRAGVRGQVMRYEERAGRVPDAAVDRLVDAYVLRQDTRRGVDWIELAHDRLVVPVRQNNAAYRRRYLHLAQTQAALWAERERCEALCLSGPALLDAERWARAHAGELTPTEAQFLAVSRKLWAAELARRARHRWLTAIAIAVALVTGGLGAWAWAKKAEADGERTMSGARELLARSQPAWAAKLLLAVPAPETRRGWVALANEVLNGGAPKATLTGHTSAVFAAVVSPDGERVVTVSSDTTARVWRADGAGDPIVLRGHAGTVAAAAWTPDGRRIATSSSDGTARVWDAGGAGPPRILSGHAAKVHAVAWSPDGARLATASEDGTARVWALDGAGDPVVLRGHEDGVVAVAWSGDGRRILTASKDGTARIWDARGRGAPIVLRGHAGRVSGAAFSPDGGRVVTASWDGTARVWDAGGAGDPVVLRGHDDKVNAAGWSPDGARVVTASDDWTARVWRADGSGAPLELKGHESRVGSVAWSADGRRIVTASDDKTARVWCPDGTGESLVLRGHAGNVVWAAFDPRGERIVTASSDNTARVWMAAGDGEPVSLARGAQRGSAMLSPDFTRVVVERADSTAVVWDTDGSGAPVVLRGHTGRVRGGAWSPDGTRIVTASDDRTARIWNADGSGDPIVLRGHDHAVLAAAWSPDGREIVTTSWDGTARIWNADGAGEPIVLRGHTDRVIAAAWSPDGKTILTGSDDATARLWRAGDGAEIGVLRGHHDSVKALAFSPGGDRIVTGSYDNTVRVWDARAGAEIVPPRSHDAPVRVAAWSPDGRQIVTGSDDFTVRVWSADGSGRPVIMRAHASPVVFAAWSADGERIVTRSEAHGGLKVWSFSIPDLRRRLERAGADCLPPELRSGYLGEGDRRAQERYEACERSHHRTPHAPERR